MNVRFAFLFSLFLASFFAAPTFAQCKNQQDQSCRSLQYILYASQTDFREFRETEPLKRSDHKPAFPNPDLSVGTIHVPCHTDFWLSSEVAMYNCSAEVSAEEAEQWYAKTLSDLQELQYLWQFKTESPGSNHFVDAGPQDCDPPQMETTNYGAFHADVTYIASGPYLGQCPLHLQTVRQLNGNSRISFWLNSSVNLARNPKPSAQSSEFSASSRPALAQPPAVPDTAAATQPASATSITATSRVTPSTVRATTIVPAAPADSPDSSSTVAPPTAKEGSGEIDHFAARSSAKYGDCDDLCQGLKAVLENRANSFRQLSLNNPTSSTPTRAPSLQTMLKLSGAESCSIHAEPSAHASSSARTEFFSHANLAPVAAKSTKSRVTRVAASPTKQYVCYWPHDSEPAAALEFRDLAGLLRLLMPPGWTEEQRNETDERSGAQLTVWSARDAKNRSAISLYLIGRSLGLHISASE